MGTIFDVAKKTPMLATEILVPFPYRYSYTGYQLIELETVPVLGDEGQELFLDDGKPVTRSRLKHSDVELWLTVSHIPASQFEQARKNVEIDCDKLGVPITVKGEESATASRLHAVERTRLILEHVTGWRHKPKELDPVEFDADTLARLVDDVRARKGEKIVNEWLFLSYTFARIDETTTAVEARVNGRPTPGKVSESLALAD